MLLVAMVAAGKDGGLRMQGALLVTVKGCQAEGRRLPCQLPVWVSLRTKMI